jgi:glycosyltransferase involved in cell wall biosynthesis
VVTDDGSSDETLAILAEFATIAPFPVRIHRNTVRLGYRANFMQAAGLCSGSLISFCDQDDVWRRDNLEQVVAGFDDPDVLLVFHNASL